jgi:hypothetical protein
MATGVIQRLGKFSQIRRHDDSPVGVVIGMTEDSENNIWAETIGPPGTLIRMQNLKVREEFSAPQMRLARKVIADPQSGIWLGLMNGDLARYRSGKTEIFSFTHQPDSRVNQLIARSDGSIIGSKCIRGCWMEKWQAKYPTRQSIVTLYQADLLE